MSRKFYLLLFSLVIFQLHCYGDPVSKALKALKKGKHQQVESVLKKSLEKFPINPGARYAFSLLYFDSTYASCSIDTAHLFIEQALIDEQLPDSLDGLPLEKADLTLDDLQAHKALVDRAAYSRAVALNTVLSFQNFIDQYSNAAQLENAISRRDILAFEIASNENSYESYKSFLDQYPDAYQVPVARERYDLLVFQSKTGSGKLEEFVQFLKEHPDTPYRNKAEWQIFQLQTLNNRPTSYHQFNKDFPQSKYVSLSNGILYHLDKKAYLETEEVPDSLIQIYHLESNPLIPIYEEGKYGFIDNQGTYQIPPAFDSIPENYLCQLLSDDVIQAYMDQNLVLMARNKKVLWDGPFDEVEDMGRGLLKLRIGMQYGLLHKSGWQLLKVEYHQIKLLGESFLAVEKNGKWGIYSMSGRLIIPIENELIQMEGDFILLKKGLWAVSTPDRIIQTFESDQQTVYEYDDWELITNDNLMVFSKDKEGILNHKLTPVIPLSSHQIHELDSADWYVKTAHGTIRFYGENLQTIPPDRYQDFLSNNHFICLNKSNQWEVWDRDSLGRLNQISYDSVARLGAHVLMLMNDKGTSLLFSSGKSILNRPNDRVKLIREAGQSMGFVQVNTKGGKRQIYDLKGNLIYQTWYYDMQPLTSNLFIIEKNGLKGIVNFQGDILIKPRYHTIVADSAEHISLLHRGRFGYYNSLLGTWIKPQYESRVTYFNEQLLLTSKKGKKGLINHKNNIIVPFEYDQIKQWTDSTVLVRKQKTWTVLNFETSTAEFEGITGLNWIAHKGSQKIIIKTKQGYGLLDDKLGMLLTPGFNDIINLGTAEEPVFFTEKYIPEADYFVVIYYNHKMEVIRKQVFDSGNYDQVYCY